MNGNDFRFFSCLAATFLSVFVLACLICYSFDETFEDFYLLGINLVVIIVFFCLTKHFETKEKDD